MYCIHCGAQLPDKVNFCSNCGRGVLANPQGDQVGGDKISVGDMSNNQAVAIGRGNEAVSNRGLSGEEIARLFAPIYQRIEARPEDPVVDKEEVSQTVRRVQQEAAKGEEANPSRIERWLKVLAGVAPDILDVVLTVLGEPTAAISAAVRKVVASIKGEQAVS